MFRNIFLQQLKRNTKRTILYLILLSSVTAFFVMSVNLYQNSLFNLQKAEQSYSTLAVMELYGDVDQFGQLTEPNSKDHIGYKSVAVEGYDISDIINADGVESWDLRAKYAAYIENTPAMRDQNGTRSDSDLLRFRLAGEEPVTFPLVWEDEWGGVHYEQAIDFEVEVLDSAAGCFRYNGLFSCDGWGVFLRDRQAYQEQIVFRLEEKLQMDLSQDADALQQWLEGYSDEAIRSDLSLTAQNPGGSFRGFFTETAVGISVSIPHALGDHVEIYLQRE